MNELTQIALDDILIKNAKQYAYDAFLGGKIGQAYLGLHRLPESLKEAAFKWNFPANVGNTNPTAKVPHGTHTWTPSDPATFACQSASSIEDNFYAYMVLPTPDSLPSRIVDIRTHQIKDLSGWQGLEWQQQISLGGQTLNMAWQFSFSSGVRTFNFASSKWEAISTVPMPDFTKPVTTICEYELSDNVTHRAITINGQRFEVGIVRSAVNTGKPNKMTISEQIDPKKGAACSLSIAQIDLRMV